MKTTVGKKVLAIDALKEFKDVKVKATLSFRLSRFEDKMSGTYKRFNEAKDKLIIEKYGVKEGEGYKVPEEKMADYFKEINELLAQEEEVDYTINLSLFEGEKVSKEFFAAMGDFIVE
jgi:hypothetical protein